jgi:predicted acetyltransferase
MCCDRRTGRRDDWLECLPVIRMLMTGDDANEAIVTQSLEQPVGLVGRVDEKYLARVAALQEVDVVVEVADRQLGHRESGELTGVCRTADFDFSAIAHASNLDTLIRVSDLRIRELTAEDHEVAWHLGATTFGMPLQPMPPPPTGGLTRWGAFDGERLVARATDLHHEQWWGGRLVPASGIGGVAVAPEYRGRGAGRQVLGTALEHARDRGAAVATLFCTRTEVYRAIGFEACGVLRHVTLPADALARRPVPPSVAVRAGTGADMALIRGVYDEVARNGNGYLSRRGGLFPDPADDALPECLSGVTLAEDVATGAVIGYLSYVRGDGYRDDAVLQVPDLLATTPEAALALLSVLATWAPVTPTLELRLPPWADAVTTALPLERLRERTVSVWMHRPLDVATAVAARGWPSAATGSVTFRLVDPVIAANDGTWQLELASGSGLLSKAPEAETPALHVRGWSLLWSGAARSAQLRSAGLLTGDPSADPLLDALLGGGGPSGLLDYF